MIILLIINGLIKTKYGRARDCSLALSFICIWIGVDLSVDNRENKFAYIIFYFKCSVDKIRLLIYNGIMNHI